MNGAAKALVCSPKLSFLCLSWLRFSHQLFFFTQVLLLQQQQSGSFFNLTHVLKAVSPVFFLMFVVTELFFRRQVSYDWSLYRTLVSQRSAWDI